MFSKLNNLRDNILESFQDINYDSYIENKTSKQKLDKAFSLVRCFISESYSNEDLQEEANQYMSILERYYKEYMLFSKSKLYEAFYNPFDNDDVQIDIPKTPYKQEPENKEIKISKVKLWDSDTTDKIYFDKGKMRAGKFYGPGDTIEICPVRLIQDDDLYSRNVRDIAFVIDSEKHLYAIPFGYASYYRNSKESGLDANSDYELIPSDVPTIRIFATSKIRKGNEIILFSDETDFENEIRPGQFEYEPNRSEYVAIKNFKLI
jgi:hypothetical protein